MKSRVSCENVYHGSMILVYFLIFFSFSTPVTKQKENAQNESLKCDVNCVENIPRTKRRHFYDINFYCLFQLTWKRHKLLLMISERKEMF